MATTVDSIIAGVIAREGPFSHLSADRGGATNWGITAGTLAAWRGTPLTDADVAALTPFEAATIYRALYFERPGLNKLPEVLWPVMLDFAVNSGPAIAISALQESLGVKADGVIGPFTIAAAVACSPSLLINAVCVWRSMMIARIVRRDPSQLTFLSGWLKRALEFIV